MIRVSNRGGLVPCGMVDLQPEERSRRSRPLSRCYPAGVTELCSHGHVCPRTALRPWAMG
jgi:hypothetical protein